MIIGLKKVLPDHFISCEPEEVEKRKCEKVMVSSSWMEMARPENMVCPAQLTERKGKAGLGWPI